MSDDVTVFVCGAKPKDHECDDKGAFVMVNADGRSMPEKEAMRLAKEKKLGKGWNTGTVTCSVCGGIDWTAWW